jgi:hypothetical protein
MESHMRGESRRGFLEVSAQRLRKRKIGTKKEEKV